MNQTLKLLESQRWRLENLYKITNKHKEEVKLRLNKEQTSIFENMSQRDYVLKTRQIGISTFYCVLNLDRTIFQRNQTSCIIAHEMDSLRKLFRIVRFAYESLDSEIKPKLDRGGGSKYELYFPDINSRIYCDLESRSDTISNLHISELAFMKDMDKVKATLDAVPVGFGNVSIETTPNGLNHAYDLWRSKNIYNKFFFPWYFSTEYKIDTKDKLVLTQDEKDLKKKAKKLFRIDITDSQINFRRFKISEKQDRTHFIQEYPEDDNTCFVTSGNSVIDTDKLKQMAIHSKPPVDFIEGAEIYIPFDKTNKYVCGVDTAEGIGRDYCVATIYDKELNQCAQLRGHFKPIDFAHKINNFCSLYQKGSKPWPLLAVERNNHGHAVILELEHNIKYRNLFYDKDGRAGWKTDRISKPIMINALIDAVESDRININSKDTIDECLTLVDNNGKIEAITGKHDDCVIATAIAIQMVLKLSTLDVYDDIKSKILL